MKVHYRALLDKNDKLEQIQLYFYVVDDAEERADFRGVWAYVGKKQFRFKVIQVSEYDRGKYKKIIRYADQEGIGLGREHCAMEVPLNTLHHNAEKDWIIQMYGTYDKGRFTVPSELNKAFLKKIIDTRKSVNKKNLIQVKIPDYLKKLEKK